jgi:hypothetical protein
MQSGGGIVDTGITNRQSVVIIKRGRWSTYMHSLYRPDLKEPGYKVAWIEKPSLCLAIANFALGFRASRALIQGMC